MPLIQYGQDIYKEIGNRTATRNPLLLIIGN